MKPIFYLIILASSLILSGCAADPDDKAFFERGWVHPGYRDTH